MTVGKKIKKIANSNRVLFTTPSHDRTSFVVPDVEEFFGRKFFHNDLSEINDLDNLAEPEGDILESMKRSAELVGVHDLFYLVNGSTSGILSAMLATLKQKDKVLIGRNCHKSVLNGLVLTGAEPVWILPKINEEWGIFNPIEPEKISESFENFSGIKAVIITSPTYEGVSSDIKKIAEICHENDAILIVDEAHGALKSFAPILLGENAVKSGADIAVQSLHKTCGAPNPCAMLQSNGKIPSEKIQNALNLTNTSSPSYPMIAAIEGTINYLFSKNGQEKIKKLISDINQLKSTFEGNLNITFNSKNDPTKIMVKVNRLNGFDLSDILFDEFNIEDELSNAKCSVLLSGIGTTKHKLKLLEKVLKSILSETYSSENEHKYAPLKIENAKMTPREAYFAEKEEIEIEKSLGRICGEVIAEYPPGIPILMLGEEIGQQQIDYLKTKRKSINVVR